MGRNGRKRRYDNSSSEDSDSNASVKRFIRFHRWLHAPPTKRPTMESYGWDEEKWIKLIKAYKARPYLWDRYNNPHFQWTAKRRAGFAEIANEFGTDERTIRYSLAAIFRRYRREDRLMRKRGATVCDWFAHKYFLDFWPGPGETTAESEEPVANKQLTRQNDLLNPSTSKVYITEAEKHNDEFHHKLFNLYSKFGEMVAERIKSTNLVCATLLMSEIDELLTSYEMLGKKK